MCCKCRADLGIVLHRLYLFRGGMTGFSMEVFFLNCVCVFVWESVYVCVCVHTHVLYCSFSFIYCNSIRIKNQHLISVILIFSLLSLKIPYCWQIQYCMKNFCRKIIYGLHFQVISRCNFCTDFIFWGGAEWEFSIWAGEW